MQVIRCRDCSADSEAKFIGSLSALHNGLVVVAFEREEEEEYRALTPLAFEP
jgi:hypothetical protein